MVFLCRDENCKKSFSIKSNRNKHEKLKKHGPIITKTRILFDESSKLYACPTEDCNVQSKYKANVLKHLKSCDAIRKKRKSITSNKICPFCSRVFGQKSNRDRHVKAVHQKDLSSSEEDIDGGEQLNTLEDSLTVDLSLPSMIFTPQIEEVNGMPDVTEDTEDLMDDLEKETSRPVSPATPSETVRSGSEN